MHVRIAIILNYHTVSTNIMTQYSTHKMNGDRWYSPPFYTGPGGYKMCIGVDANGSGSGTDTHVSVTVFLMRGEYDSGLVWPLHADITIQLVNHNNHRDHHKKTVTFSETAIAEGDISDLVPPGERAKYVLGIFQYITHTDVESSCTTSKRYIIYNCLTCMENEHISTLALFTVPPP